MSQEGGTTKAGFTRLGGDPKASCKPSFRSAAHVCVCVDTPCTGSPLFKTVRLNPARKQVHVSVTHTHTHPPAATTTARRESVLKLGSPPPVDSSGQM